jgi:hypothetical protein
LFAALILVDRLLGLRPFLFMLGDDKIALTKQHKAILDNRLYSYRNSAKRITWEAIKKKVRTKKAK